MGVGDGVSGAFSHLQAVPPSSGGAALPPRPPAPSFFCCCARRGWVTPPSWGRGWLGCSSPSFGGAGSPNARQPPMVPGSCPGREPAGLSRTLPSTATRRMPCPGEGGEAGGGSACPRWGTGVLPLGMWSSPRDAGCGGRDAGSKGAAPTQLPQSPFWQGALLGLHLVMGSPESPQKPATGAGLAVQGPPPPCCHRAPAWG